MFVLLFARVSQGPVGSVPIPLPKLSGRCLWGGGPLLTSPCQVTRPMTETTGAWWGTGAWSVGMPQKERRGNWHGVRNREAADTESSYKREAPWQAAAKAAMEQ